MDNTTFLAAWIEGNLSDFELEKTVGKAASNQYKKIRTSSSKLYLSEVESLKWEVFSQQLTNKKRVFKKTRKWIFTTAASFAILFGIGSFSLSQKEHLAIDSYTQVELSDGSLVQLAPGASLHYRRSYNLLDRKLHLSGEAFFQVEKGSPFIVNTPHGSIEVVGTAFKVIDTPDFFKVICTEGEVKLKHQEKTYFLSKGFALSSNAQKQYKVDLNQYKNKSTTYYNSVPLKYIVQLVSNLYNIRIDVDSRKTHFFTGSIPLNNQEKALKAISLPFSFNVIKRANKEFLLIEK